MVLVWRIKLLKNITPSLTLPHILLFLSTESSTLKYAHLEKPPIRGCLGRKNWVILQIQQDGSSKTWLWFQVHSLHTHRTQRSLASLASRGLYDSLWQLLVSVRGKKVQSGRVLFPPWNEPELTGQGISRDICCGALNYPVTLQVNPTSMLQLAINIYLYWTDHL